MNRILKIIAAIAFSVIFSVTAAYAADDWNTSVSGAAEAVCKQGSIQLILNEGSAARSASAEKIFDFSGNTHIGIAFEADISGMSSEINRKLYLRQSALKATELLNFNGDKLIVLGASTVKEALSEGKHNVAIGIDLSEEKLTVYLDGEKVFSDSMGSAWKSYDMAALKMYIRNYTNSGENIAESAFRLNELAISDRTEGFTASPSDGSTYLLAEKIDGIELTFDAVPSPKTFANDNFVLKRNGEIVAAETKGAGVKCTVKPTGGFEADSEYTLEIKAVYDMFDNVVSENETITIETAAEGYAPPEVTVSVDKTDIYTTQHAVVSVRATSGIGIAGTELYINGVLCEKFDCDGEYNFRGESGRYEIYAMTLDTLGGVNKSASVFVNIVENILPKISFEGIRNGEPQAVNLLKKVSVIAEDEDGTVEKLKVYLGGELILEKDGATAELDLSTLAYGRYLLRVEAYDNADGCAVSELNLIAAAESKERLIVNTNFTTYNSTGTELPAGSSYILRPDGAEILSTKDYGDNYGTSVLYRVTGKEASWLRLDTSGSTAIFVVEMDAYVLNPNGKINFYFRHPSQSITMDPLTFSANKLRLGRTDGAAVEIAYPAGEWHKIRIYVDLISHKYSTWVDGVLVAEDFGIHAAMTQADLRVALSVSTDGEPSGMVFDNLMIKYIEPAVQITSVGYDGVDDCMTVNPLAKELVFKLNASLDASSLSNKSVLLYCGDEQMIYDKVKWSEGDKKLTVVLREKLQSNKKYRIELTNAVADVSGALLKNGAAANFETGYADFDVKDVSLVKNSGKVSGSFKLINSTDTEKECFYLLNVFSGKKFVDTIVKKVVIAANSEKTYRTESVSVKEGETAELYFWDSLQTQGAMTKTVYSK